MTEKGVVTVLVCVIAGWLHLSQREAFVVLRGVEKQVA